MAGAGKFCANCLNRLELLDISPYCVTCKCSNCQSQRFSTCGGCLTVPYCSRECQKEHWMYNHKSLCKMFSGEKIPREACLARALNKVKAKEQGVPPKFYLLQVRSEELLESYFWSIFKSADGTLDCCPTTARENAKPRVIEFPFIVGEGEKNGWIDQYLDYLNFLVLTMIVAEGKSCKELSNLWQLVLRLRAVYFFHFSLEKDRKLTELKFAVLALRQLSFDLSSCSSPAFDPIESYDVKIRSSGAPTEVWETLIFTMAKFYKRLRMVKYKFINMESFQKKRPSDHRALEPFYQNGQRLLNNVQVPLDCDGGYDTNKSRATLPPNTRCVGCHRDIGGSRAQLLLGRDIWAPGYKMIKIAGTPCVLEMMDSPRPIVTCGKDERCNNRAKELYHKFLGDEMMPLLEVLPDCRICDGCSRYSLKTHKCSRCRSARYCSQDCLSQDWKYHKLRCQEVEREELSISKKLEGEARQEYSRECFNRIVNYDPVIGAMARHCLQE